MSNLDRCRIITNFKTSIWIILKQDGLFCQFPKRQLLSPLIISEIVSTEEFLGKYFESFWIMNLVVHSLTMMSLLHYIHLRLIRNPTTQSMERTQRRISSVLSFDCYEPNGPPDRIYKVVFAGDAAVGKTTFILRICKGTFIPCLTSTLGVDFHVKTLRVDEKNVTLQLWDTAGQER